MIRNIALVFLIAFVLGCVKEEDAKETIKIIFPEDLQTCLSIPSNSNMSVVDLKWEGAGVNDSYEVIITNLATNKELVFSVQANQLSVVLENDMFYSWRVRHKSRKVYDSPLHKFFLGGDPVVTHAPEPAKLIRPEDQAVVSSGWVHFEWETTNNYDTSYRYDFYLGSKNNMRLYAANLKESFCLAVTPYDSRLFYWKVVTKDGKNHESHSALFRLSER